VSRTATPTRKLGVRWFLGDVLKRVDSKAYVPHDAAMSQRRSSLEEARERIVREHVAAEERGDWDGALATFARPRYEIMATAEVHDGASAVRDFYDETRRAFSELAFETRALRHAEDSVLTEVTFVAVHAGPWRGLPATKRRLRYPMLNVFLFEEDRLICERMYFDLLTPLRQIGVARDPLSVAGKVAMAVNHPVVVAGAFLRSAASLVRHR
jgi:steroid delta-isomerase-like uncharacterized protein